MKSMAQDDGLFEVHRFGRAQYFRMIDAGVFDDGERIELLHGRLAVVPPQGPPHAATVASLHERLSGLFAGRCCVRGDMPLDCGEGEVPEPDLAVVSGQPFDFAKRHPRGDECVIVVEISRTSQAVDREKASVYAAAGVPVYWLVDIAARRIEVHAQPVSGGRYGLVRVIGEDEEVDVPTTTQRWRVADLLPPV
jgi:Uma2 family endonuclease